MIARARTQNTKTQAALGGFVDWLKDVPCFDCKCKLPPHCMDFDHVSGNKKFNVSEAKRRHLSGEAVIEEVMKCEVVCANCHRQRTHLRMPGSTPGHAT